jgi:hypothetical protein
VSLTKSILLGGCLFWLAGPLTAQTPPAETAPAEPLIEPAAIAALQDMGAYLAGLERFTLDADTLMEVVLDSEQKLMIGGQARYQVQRPDRLRIDLATDVVNRQLFYDGSSVTYVAPDQNSFARLDAVPDNIHDLLAVLARDYAVAFPAADLFLWGTEAEPVDLVTEAFHVGTSVIGGTDTQHWAFRSEGQDWEVWIDAEGPPLPLRISLVDQQDPAKPRFTASYHWTVDAVIPPDSFTYTPPATAALVPFLTTQPEPAPAEEVQP